MAHWAEVDENNKVVRVIVTSNRHMDEGKAWLERNYGGTWIKTSYNTSQGQHSQGGTQLRGNFAGPGFDYDSELDAFIPPKPFDSWILDTNIYDWKAPVEKPKGHWNWDEDAGTWVEGTAITE